MTATVLPLANSISQEHRTRRAFPSRSRSRRPFRTAHTGIQGTHYSREKSGSVGLGEMAHDIAIRHATTDRQFVDGEDPVRPMNALRFEVVPIRSHVTQALGPLEQSAFALQPLYGKKAIFGSLGRTERDSSGLDQSLRDTGEF